MNTRGIGIIDKQAEDLLRMQYDQNQPVRRRVRHRQMAIAQEGKQERSPVTDRKRRSTAGKDMTAAQAALKSIRQHSRNHHREVYQDFGPIAVQLRNEGRTLAAIAMELNQIGPTPYGSVWSPAQVGRVVALFRE